ncbi:hypothetical protein CDL15_Pgr001998 [Punica granatum]|uniref:Uncharacterized protein n=1 Tax=Punica granatum TaxID=22663 RepID=A0A218XBW8_PUNGR|nr:hypothetical protein CDL15_Pgr001998 [Punica granatum]
MHVPPRARSPSEAAPGKLPPSAPKVDYAAVKQLHKGFLLLLLRRTTRTCNCLIGTSRREENVRSGQFSVVALGNRKPEKFVIGLRYLTHPKFLELLDKAEREFGFDQTGVLIIPCEASELQKILRRKPK